jgi:CheY-like chemotaxis protein
MQLSPSLSVLIIDDEEELASLYKQFVASIGLDGTSFTKPLLALEHYQQCPDKYSLIMTDLRMPGMNGIEFANKIRISNLTIKIFLITAFDILDLEKEPTFQKARINKILQKPIKLSTLKSIIQSELQNF